MDIKQLEYFLAIAEEKNISRAAEKLHVSQPPISQQLKLLEDELGVKLIERTTRKLELTDSGQALQRKAMQILELVDGTVKELKDIDKGLRGILSIGSIRSLSSTLLLKIIVEFHKNYPGINFHVIDEDTEKTIELLSSGIIEIGIVRTPVAKDVFEAIALPDDPMVAIAVSSRLKNQKKSLKIIDLYEKPLIVQRRYEKQIADLCHQAGFDPKILCTSNDVRTILAWANLDMGIAILPKLCIDLIKNTNLSYHEFEESFIKVGSAVIWLKSRYLSSAARYFLESIKSYIESI